jgi:cysteinyl-tRNA synthetase, unknown class
MKRKLIYALISFVCIGVGAFYLNLPWENSIGKASEQSQATFNSKTAMIDLIEDLHKYSIAKNPSFELMGNNGLGLFAEDEDNSVQDVERLLASVNGIIMEEFNYGWEMKDDRITAGTIQREVLENLTIPQKEGVPILNIDYCSTQRHLASSYEKNDGNGFVGFAANHRQLDNIPAGAVHNENNKNIQSLKDIGNFLILLNPDKFKNKSDYLDSLCQTNYDLLIIDMEFDGELLTAEDIASLKIKANGGRRLVFAYMSVGEAEDYRSYWKSEWSDKHPSWIAEENENWQGNFKVKYWTKEWRAILFGSKEACLDQILQLGFDGSFMDVIDSYEYFAKK